MTDVDQYALQKSLFGGTDTELHNKAYREELHAREKDQIPNPNVNPGQYAPKGGRNPLLKVVQHATGWTASTMLPGGKEFRVEGNDRQHAISQAIRAGEKMGHIFDPPKAEPEIGGLFHGGQFDEKVHPRESIGHGTKHAGEFAPKHQDQAAPAEAPFVLQRPKKNRAVATFDNNANTKQGGLFDAGKKNELPGQNLLFNSDAGDLHNPKTMENKVASSESKSQPDSRAIAEEAVKNNENIGTTMERHGVTIKGHPQYRDIRKQVMGHVDTLREQAKPQPSPARQRAMDKQAGQQEPAASGFNHDQHVKIAADSIVSLRKQDVYRLLEFAPKEHRRSVADHIGKHRPEFMDEINESLSDLGEPAVKYSRRVYEQFEHETERYLRDYTLYDVDRYGMGGKMMKMLLAFMAMHAMGHMMKGGNKSQDRQQVKPAATAGSSSPSNQDFEKLHPRESVQGGAHKPGQFAKKPAGATPSGASPPETDRDAEYNRKQAEFDASRAASQHDDPAQIEREQQAADMKHHIEGARNLNQRFETKANASDQPSTSVQAPQDRHTAKVAEIWHGKQEPITVSPERTAISPMREARRNADAPTAESFTNEVMQHHAGQGQESPQPESSDKWWVDNEFVDAVKQHQSHHDPPEQEEYDHLPAPRNYPNNLKSFNNFSEMPQIPDGHVRVVHHGNIDDASLSNGFKYDGDIQSNTVAYSSNDQIKWPTDDRFSGSPAVVMDVPHDIHRQHSRVQTAPGTLDAKYVTGRVGVPKQQESPAPQPAIADIMRNPAAEARKAKAEVDKRTKFNPAEFRLLPEQPDAPGRKLTIQDTGGDYDALDAAEKDRAKSVKANRDWEKKVNENPDENIASVASEHELDHEPFSKYANEMQAFEQDQWKQREAVKTGIRKAWGVHGGTLRDMENKKGLDHSSLASTDNLKGNLTDAQIHEHLGSDEGSWSQNAWAMLREDPPPKPGAHDREWLDNHAKAYKHMQSLHHPDPEEYPEPDYDPVSGEKMPFSRRSLAMAADRYFRQFRDADNKNRPQNWTILDSWV